MTPQELQEEWEKIQNEPADLKYSRAEWKQDVFGMLLVLAGNNFGKITVERLETLSLQLRQLLYETGKLRRLMIEYEIKCSKDKETNE